LCCFYGTGTGSHYEANFDFDIVRDEDVVVKTGLSDLTTVAAIAVNISTSSGGMTSNIYSEILDLRTLAGMY